MAGEDGEEDHRQASSLEALAEHGPSQVGEQAECDQRDPDEDPARYPQRRRE